MVFCYQASIKMKKTLEKSKDCWSSVRVLFLIFSKSGCTLRKSSCSITVKLKGFFYNFVLLHKQSILSMSFIDESKISVRQRWVCPLTKKWYVIDLHFCSFTSWNHKDIKSQFLFCPGQLSLKKTKCSTSPIFELRYFKSIGATSSLPLFATFSDPVWILILSHVLQVSDFGSLKPILYTVQNILQWVCSLTGQFPFLDTKEHNVPYRDWLYSCYGPGKLYSCSL